MDFAPLHPVLLLACLLSYCIYATVAIHAHLRAVRSIPSLRLLPVIIAPVAISQPIWFFAAPVLLPVLSRVLPRRWSLWLRVSYVGWTYKEGQAVADAVWERAVAARANEKDRERWLQLRMEMRATFVIVHPGGWTLNFCDHAAVATIVKRFEVWHKPEGVALSILEIYGPNLDSTNGAAWGRNRRVTAPCFNERTSELVWDESARQAQAMLEQWTADKDNIVRTMSEDTRTVALHVISYAGFEEQEDFSCTAVSPSAGHELTYRDALVTILQNPRLVTSVCLLPTWLRESRIGMKLVVPKAMQHVELSLHELHQYMREMLQATRDSGAKDKPHLLAALVRNSEAESSARNRLTDDEVMGNLYVFSLAGHETTANTMAFAMTLLSVHTEVQDWAAEEAKRVLGSEDVELFGKYRDLFPRLIRIRAVMYETLRLYGPVVFLPRINKSPTSIPLSSGSDIFIPANVDVTLDCCSMHVSPAWDTPRATARQFSPQRWLQVNPHTGEEEIVQPPQTTFMPWASGPRACPGMKFSQVEFGAVLGTLLRSWRLRPALGDRKEAEQLAAQKIQQALQNAGLVDGITTAMKRHERPTFRLERAA